ncbi:hypothetical protein C7S20_08095 [Christiangramia fulva]|uniref:DUF4296 domain-containing protein n=1 Tax=Christiangramia fulva TaxID=2126553 RepID=A0A2R3Z4S0_9FLAO|nr:DUF4296 domain-containing protein [Christiangramia fulva]AVR45234.1 hypothetical protein C7S20_08095 [Christiangramia fulva]
MKDRKKHILSLVALVFLLNSCQHIDKMEKPDNLIPEGKMIDILTEVSLVQAARNYNKSKLEQMGITPDDYIYKKFNIDSVQFEKSTEWYAENYVRFDRMYDSVKARIQVLKTRMDSLAEVERKIKDSISKVRKDSLRSLDPEKYDRDSIIEAKQKMLQNKNNIIHPSISTSRDSIL